jgi:hypothetical protein
MESGAILTIVVFSIAGGLLGLTLILEFVKSLARIRAGTEKLPKGAVASQSTQEIESLRNEVADLKEVVQGLVWSLERDRQAESAEPLTERIQP